MRNCCLLLVAFLVCNSAAAADPVPQASGSGQERTQDSERAAKVKAEVQRRGVGEKSRVRVTLVNKVSVNGYVSKIDEVSFDVTDRQTTAATTVSYAEVQRIRGPALSKGAKIGIAVGVAVAVVGVTAAVLLAACGPYCK